MDIGSRADAGQLRVDSGEVFGMAVPEGAEESIRAVVPEELRGGRR